MANNANDKLLVSIGLNMSELESDIAMAEKTVRENLSAFNRANNLIRLRMQVDTANLDPVKDKTRILEIQEKSLNDQLKIQSDRVKILTAEYNALLTRMDKNSAAAQKAEMAMLREQLAAKKLEEELKQVSQLHQQLTAPKGAGDILSGFADKISSIDPRIGSIVSSVRNLGAVAGETGEVFKTLGGTMATTLGPGAPIVAGCAATAAAMAAVVAAGVKVEETLINIARPAIAAGDSVYVLSRRMAESVKSASAFNTTLKAIGSDTATVLGGLDRLSKAWLTAGAGGNAATHALEQFGATLTDQDGKLLSYDERMKQLSNAFAQAKATGQQAQLQTLLFKNGMGDLVVAIEDYAAVQKQVDEQLTKSAFGNPQLAHDLQTEVHLLDMQAAQLGSVFSQAFMPVAEDLLPQAIEQMGLMVKMLNDNKDAIQTVGEAVSAVFGGMGQLVSGVLSAIDAVSERFRKLRDAIRELDDMTIRPYVDDSSIKTFEEYVKKAHAEVDINFLNPDQQAYTLGNYQREWDNIVKKRAEIEEKAQKEMESQQAAAGGGVKLQTEAELADIKKASEARVAAQKMALEAQISASNERVKVINAEYSDLVRIAASGEGDVYAVVEDWQKQINSEYAAQTQKRIELIQQEYDAKIAVAGSAEAVELEKQKQQKITDILLTEERRREQVIRDSNERTKGYIREAQDVEYGITHTGLEKNLHDIQRWKEAQMEKASTAKEVAAIIADAAAKEARAFEDEVNRIKDLNKSLEEKIFEKTHSQYQNDIYKLQKEVYEALQKGADKSLVDEYYRVTKNEIETKRRNDKSGDYAKTPAGQGWAVIDFTKNRPPAFSSGNGDYFRYQQEKMEELARQQLGLNQEIQRTSQEMRALSDFGDIAGTRRSVAQTTVSPTINVNVDLGGAYVFDDAMKNQLTHDVAAQVSSEVTDAVKSATVTAGLSIAG